MPVDKKEENQKKIAYLKKYKYAILDEKMILEEIQRLRADKMFPSLAMDGMPHGNGTSDLSEYAARLDEEINKLKDDAKLKRIKIIGVDGATDYIRPYINKLSEEDFEIYKKYQLSICERPELLGASSHILDILEK